MDEAVDTIGGISVSCSIGVDGVQLGVVVLGDVELGSLVNEGLVGGGPVGHGSVEVVEVVGSSFGGGKGNSSGGSGVVISERTDVTGVTGFIS